MILIISGFTNKMIDYGIKIIKFKIKNFRIFEGCDLTFNEDNLYTLIGRNGTGKTALLEAINISLSENSSKFNKIREDDFYSDNPIILTVEFNKPFFLVYPEYRYKRLIPCKKFTKIIKKRDRKAPGELFSSEYQIDWAFEPIEYSRLADKDYLAKATELKPFLPSDTHLVCSLRKDGDDYTYTIQSSEEERIIKKHEVPYLDRVLFPQVFYFDKNRDRELLPEYRTAFSNIVEELDWRYKKKLQEDDNKADLKNKYTELHNKISELSDYQKELFLPAVSILKEDLEIDCNVEELTFFFLNLEKPFRGSSFGRKTCNDKFISVEKIGSGISILISLSILIAFAEQSKNPIVVLIDEPELHLHADLQKQLFMFMKSKNFQTFLSTHSHLFVNKVAFENNLSFQKDSLGKISIESCNQITLANTLFGTLGNSLEDLYVPEELLLVEGVYDKKILTQVLALLQVKNKSTLLLDCGGYTKVPPKGELIGSFFEKYIDTDNWYSEFIKRKFRVIVDSDVNAQTIANWKSKYSLQDEQVVQLSVPGIEYLYPESLVKQVVIGKQLKDGSEFSDKNRDEIVQIILSDEHYRNDSKKLNLVIQSQDQIVSKQRLNEFIENNLTNEILSKEAPDLKKLGEWIAGNPTPPSVEFIEVGEVLTVVPQIA